MSKPAKTKGKDPTYRIPADSPWQNAWKVAAGLGALGAAGCVAGVFSDPHRFAFSWLFAFMSFLALGLGSLFFVISQHLTGAWWGVSLRRTAEMLMTGLPALLILFVPIALSMDELYPWLETAGEHGEGAGEHGGGHEGGGHEGGAEHGALGFGDGAVHAQEARDPWDVHPDERGPLPEGHDTPEGRAHTEIMASKTWWLTHSGFLIRACIYFLAWILLAYFYFTNSTRQDKERGLALTQRMEKAAPVSTFIFAFSGTFAVFDWMMSTEPTWYSTIFGVIYWSICCILAHAVIILLTMGMRRAVFGNAINVEHYHDMGKMLHGFIVFWAYVSVSQFLLIWYAGIPEESTYYHLRWWGGGGWATLSTIIIIGGFVVPFFMLMSRNFKRNLSVLGFGAAWIVVMQILQFYWLVMPYAEQTALVETSLRLHWLDFSAFFAVGGIYLAIVLWNMTRFPLVPVGDPRLERALNHEVV